MTHGDSALVTTSGGDYKPGMNWAICAASRRNERLAGVTLYARSRATVLLKGKRGTGKELAAQAIHRSVAFTASLTVRISHPSLCRRRQVLARLLGMFAGWEHLGQGAFTGSRRGRAGLF